MVNAIAILQGSAVISGMVWFSQKDMQASTTIHANITGLTPGPHGFHVHEFGDLSNGKYTLKYLSKT